MATFTTPTGAAAAGAFSTAQQTADYLEIHNNPLGQSKNDGSRYSVTEVANTIGAPPTRNMSPTSFKGGRSRIAIAAIEDSVTYKYYTGLLMDMNKPITTCLTKIQEVNNGFIEFSTSVAPNFPDTSDITDSAMDIKKWRNVGAGINLKCFVPPGATATGILHAFVFTQRRIYGSSVSTTISGLRNDAYAAWEVPVTAGCTIRNPLTLDQLDFASLHEGSPVLMFVVEWDGEAHNTLIDVARYDQMLDNHDISPAQHNMDSGEFANLMQVIDYGSGSNPFGLAHIPLIVSGNSFVSKSKDILRKIVGAIKKNPTLVGALMSAGQQFLS